MIFYTLLNLSHFVDFQLIVENFIFVKLISPFTHLSHSELLLSEDIYRTLRMRGVLTWQSMIAISTLESQD